MSATDITYGWMYRFRDGVGAGQTLGPVALEPPEELILWTDGIAFRAGPYTPELAAEFPEAEHYRRVQMSQFTDEQMAKLPHVVRGAEYEAVPS